MASYNSSTLDLVPLTHSSRLSTAAEIESAPDLPSSRPAPANLPLASQGLELGDPILVENDLFLLDAMRFCHGAHHFSSSGRIWLIYRYIYLFRLPQAPTGPVFAYTPCALVTLSFLPRSKLLLASSCLLLTDLTERPSPSPAQPHFGCPRHHLWLFWETLPHTAAGPLQSALSAGRTIERSRRDGNARTFNCHSANHTLWSDFGTLLDRPLPQTRGFHSVPSRLIHHQRHLLLLSLPLLHLSVPLVLLLALVLLLLYNDKSVRRTGSRIGDIPSAEKRGVFYSGVN